MRLFGCRRVAAKGKIGQWIIIGHQAGTAQYGWRSADFAGAGGRGGMGFLMRAMRHRRINDLAAAPAGVLVSRAYEPGLPAVPVTAIEPTLRICGSAPAIFPIPNGASKLGR
jgi:hypothetical protein